MSGQAIRLGPFTSINTESDPTALADSELVTCNNLSRDIDGSLVSRPPIATTTTSGTFTERILVLGVATHPTSGASYLIGSNANGTFYFFGGAWVQLSASFEASAMVQYNGIVYLLAVPNATNSLAQWNFAVFTILNPANLQTMMGTVRGGSAMRIHKNRLFIVSGPKPTAASAGESSRLFFSQAGQPQTYTTTSDFFEIGSGDGTTLNDLNILNGRLVLFKSDSTWTLDYVESPTAPDIQVVDTTIGVLEPRQQVVFEGVLYLYHEGKVFATTNLVYTQINLKVPFVYDASAPSTREFNVFVCVFGDRILVRYYNTMYVYSVNTKTWSTWSSVNTELHNFGPLVAMPSSILSAVNEEYYGGSSLVNSTKVFIIKDGYSSSDVESADGVNYSIPCTVKTKNYDLANSYQFKKLNHWGVELLAASEITGIATPVVVGFSATWGLLFSSVSDWSTLSTWFNPISSPSVTSGTEAVPGSPIRRFVRFPKALRFRLINFQVDFSTDGSTASGPCKLFSITMFTSTKQIVPKQSN